MEGKRVIELGAGCALSGIAAAVAGANIVITDQAPLLDLIRENVARNLSLAERQRVQISELNWGQDITTFQPPFDVIIGSDIVYALQNFEELGKSLVDLSSLDTTVVLAYEHRWNDVERWFFEMLSKNGFTWEDIPYREIIPEYYFDKIRILQMKKRM